MLLVHCVCGFRSGGCCELVRVDAAAAAIDVVVVVSSSVSLRPLTSFVCKLLAGAGRHRRRSHPRVVVIVGLLLVGVFVVVRVSAEVVLSVWAPTAWIGPIASELDDDEIAQSGPNRSLSLSPSCVFSCRGLRQHASSLWCWCPVQCLDQNNNSPSIVRDLRWYHTCFRPARPSSSRQTVSPLLADLNHRGRP